ncbi:DUF1285 domain-containing protein [Falsirhodobacter algicola]|uniref:DUF1285 domain-containing protein n=1 Tax=Falsirhodobacter algicola TaxID=2692330 RepID=UPI00201388E8|nr:DUF1285 domain-containing protein [Falsirhodobacter algicola]
MRGLIRTSGPAPVHLWDPPFCGMIDMRIDREGVWHHEGRPITRPALVQLFSNILKREGEGYVLVTPVEKVGITVEDVPFVVIDAHVAGAGIDLITQVGDRVPLTGLRMAGDVPYAPIRGGMEGRIDRKTFYRLVDLAVEEDGRIGLRTDRFIPIGPAAA